MIDTSAEFALILPGEKLLEVDPDADVDKVTSHTIKREFTPDNDPENSQEFSVVPRLIEGVGLVEFGGTRAWNYDKSSPRGIAIVEGRLIEATSAEFRSKGLFDADIYVSELLVPTRLKNCRVLIPTDTGQITIVSRFDLDSDAEEDDPAKYSAQTTKWIKPGNNRGYNFFVAPDAVALSELRFGFDFANRARTPK